MVSFKMWHRHKQGLTNWRGGRRSRLVSFETWHIINKDSPTGGEEVVLLQLKLMCSQKMAITNVINFVKS